MSQKIEKYCNIYKFKRISSINKNSKLSFATDAPIFKNKNKNKNDIKSGKMSKKVPCFVVDKTRFIQILHIL